MGTTPSESVEREVFVATVTERADGGETCTISPLPESERALLAEWVLAHEESFVALEEIR
ncbi:DUF7511 domain-containing protein [Salinibaculum salinum]|uniref:DUF7511 domain-containing protein n=1 Tax=Salinibaculum salinum TaxID=3131996 RepID=UPI0030ED1EED